MPLTTLNDSRSDQLVTFSGNAADFGNRDLRKWVYSTYKCIKEGYAQPGEGGSGGETWSYCLVMFDRQPTQFHGLCLPPTRRWDEFAIEGGGSVSCLDCTGYGCSPADYPSGVLYAFVYAYLAVLVVLGWLVVKAGMGKAAAAADPSTPTLLSAFSPKRNFAALFAPRTVGGIPCLDGLRVLALVWIMVGHVFMLLPGFVPNGEEVGDALSNNILNLWLNNFTLSTDLFFVLSGCVCIYNGLGRSTRPTIDADSDCAGSNSHPRTSNKGCYYYYSWLKQHYTHRLVRVWPALAFSLSTLTVISFSLPFHLRPALSLFTKARACVYGGIVRNLLFLNSLFQGPLCGGYTWHISTDFIFYALVAPIALVLLLKAGSGGRRGFFVFIGGLVVGSVLLSFAAISANNYPPTTMFWRQPAQFSPYFIMHFTDYYVKPWYRVGAYAVGMLLGAELFYHDNQGPTSAPQCSSHGLQPPVSSITTSLLSSLPCCQQPLLFSLLLISWSIIGVYPALQEWNCPTYHLIYGAVFRTTFSIGVALLIRTCHTSSTASVTHRRSGETSRLLNSLLGSRLLLPFSALSYSLYTLTSTPVILALFFSLHPPRFTGVVGMLPVCGLVIASGYCYAFVCYMLVEKPALQLERLLRHRGGSSGKEDGRGGGDDKKTK